MFSQQFYQHGRGREPARSRRLARDDEPPAATLGAFHFLACACLMLAGLFRLPTGSQYQTLDPTKDLHLDSGNECLIHEYWVRTFKASFTTRPLVPYDCDVYCVVKKQPWPVLISLSRHIQQMAFDIKGLAYDEQRWILRDISRAVAGNPYQLRIYVPDGFKATRAELTDSLQAAMKTEGKLLTADDKSSTRNDVEWRIFSQAPKQGVTYGRGRNRPKHNPQ